MQCLILDDTAFVSEQCNTPAGALSGLYNVVPCAGGICGRYPLNVALNAAVIGQYIVCRSDTLDPQVRAYCNSHGYQFIHVRQGYAKCSCAIVGNQAVITADKWIYHSIRELNEIDVILIGEGSICLEGAEYGFIGGASGYDPGTNTLYFCGNIARHPDGERISDFCRRHGVAVISLSDTVLTDIGGMIFC